jgi:hypothetical protein
MSASAIVTVTLRVILSQPWSDKHRVGDVIDQARREALNTVNRLIENRSDMSIAIEPVVKVIYEEGR